MLLNCQIIFNLCTGLHSSNMWWRYGSLPYATLSALGRLCLVNFLIKLYKSTGNYIIFQVLIFRSDPELEKLAYFKYLQLIQGMSWVAHIRQCGGGVVANGTFHRLGLRATNSYCWVTFITLFFSNT